jgi:MoaA/NifB/PqqE/SkfB family radical SAM enzyme
VKYKYIIHERIEDAPFIGALIVANDCNLNCKDCFNQHLKEMEAIEKTPEDIIKEVKSNPFNEGIILGGLEWSTDPEGLIDLINEAHKQDLRTIIYTGLTYEKFCERVPEVENELIKSGPYDPELVTNKNRVRGILLATENQMLHENGVKITE